MKPTVKIAVLHDHSVFDEKKLSVLTTDLTNIEIVFITTHEEDLLLRSELLSVDTLVIDLKKPHTNALLTAKKLEHCYKHIKCVMLNNQNEKCMELELQPKKIKLKVATLKDNISEEAISQKSFNAPIIQFSNEKCNEKSLTKREIEIIRLISKEFTNKEIADYLCLSIRTIDGHKERIMQKTKSKNAVGIVMYATRCNLLEA